MCLEDQFEIQEIQQLRGQLEEVRALLVSRPGEFALAGVQPRLQEIADGLTKMNERVGSNKESLTDENRREIAELLNMATRDERSTRKHSTFTPRRFLPERGTAKVLRWAICTVH